MTNANSNIRLLADYRQPGEELNIAAVTKFLDDKRTQLRAFEKDTLELIRGTEHTSKEMEPVRKLAYEYELTLVDAANWLEDKILDVAADEKSKYEAMLERCKGLKDKNEDIKKNIGQDISAANQKENKRLFNPANAGTLLVAIPLAVYNAIKASGSGRDALAVEVGAGTAVVGAGFVFRHQANDLFLKAGKVVPPKVRETAIGLRGAYAAAALGVSILMKESSEIQPSFRPLAIRRPMLVYTLAK